MTTPGEVASPNEGAGTPARSEKRAAKERQKLEKANKLAAKQARAALQSSSSNSPKLASVTTELPPYVERTPVGQKKILGPLDSPYHSAYNPAVVESAWDSWWAKEKFFEPEFAADGETLDPGSFVIPIPPPNVTGALHIGHALGTALQDLLIRWHRMRGFTTLYLPGCDHASISTQSVVEKILWKKEKKTRHDLGRQQFLERALEWKHEYHTKINTVLHRLGGSFDWTREAFTMDPNLSNAVLEAFVRLYDDGLIYRSNRLVNWSVQLNTTISNLEVETKELSGRTLLDVPGYDRKVEFGVLTYFRYVIEGSEESIEVGTTRLETMLGDTAIAVNSKDERYKHLVGKFARHPFLDRSIPIIADDIADPTFGTGAVKITPAHDPNDYAVGVRHKLPFINILNDDGTMNHNTGRFEGQKRYDVRYSLLEELTKLGLFVKKEPNPMSIRLCIKSKDVIEPVMKPQWWLKIQDLAVSAMDVVRNGEIKIRPESAEKNYFRWLESVNDWCLSRQLWWGHQVPAWLVVFTGETSAEAESKDRWVVGRNESEARKKAEEAFQGIEFSLVRDPDVLDTWFSSGLWPFATLGWPEETHDLEKLFPTSLLESGWDILFFWIARMIMLSLKLTGKVPFKEVYCHSLIRDAQGRKMSKSLGNVIDPLAVINGITLEALQEGLKAGNLDQREVEFASKSQRESFPSGIPECGADALRFSLISYTSGGGDIAFDINVMAGYRRFCNKIYQATKYVLGKIPTNYTPPTQLNVSGKKTLPERWIRYRLNSTAKAIHQALEEREFSRSSQIIYQYWYNDLCDENSKAILANGSDGEKESTIDTLYAALEAGLTMIHPFMPFVSEELWQRLPRRLGDTTPSIVKAKYPQHRPEFDDTDSSQKYELLIVCSKALRSLMSEYGVKKDGTGYISCSDDTTSSLLRSEMAQIQALGGKSLGSLAMLERGHQPSPGCAVFPLTSTTAVYLDVSSHVEVMSLLERTKIKLAKVLDLAERQRKLLGGNGLDRFSAAAKTAEEEKLSAAEAQIKSLESSLEQFKKLDLDGH